jgi:hypothetical protein
LRDRRVDVDALANADKVVANIERLDDPNEHESLASTGQF